MSACVLMRQIRPTEARQVHCLLAGIASCHQREQLVELQQVVQKSVTIESRTHTGRE